MDHTEKGKPLSLCDLPQEILQLIAMKLDLPDCLHFRAVCRWIRPCFDISALIIILNKVRMRKIQTIEIDASEMLDEDCQFRRCRYILRHYNLSGDILESASHSRDYGSLINWLIDHGASFQKVPGGINRLCCEAFEQGDYKKFRWLYAKGACLDILAGMVFKIPGDDRPRSHAARRSHLHRLRKALKNGAKPCGAHEGLRRYQISRLRQQGLRRHKDLIDGRTRFCATIATSITGST